eukprot:4873682-Alexandrium_andersonii.AAC.1
MSRARNLHDRLAHAAKCPVRGTFTNAFPRLLDYSKLPEVALSGAAPTAWNWLEQPGAASSSLE